MDDEYELYYWTQYAANILYEIKIVKNNRENVYWIFLILIVYRHWSTVF